MPQMLCRRDFKRHYSEEMGFTFCFSILINVLVVRTDLMSAVMSAFGKWNWYDPIKRLRRLNTEDDEKTSEENPHSQVGN